MEDHKRTAIIALGICTVIILGIYLTHDKPKPPVKKEETKIIIPQSAIDELYANSILYRIEPGNNLAYIYSHAWQNMNIDTKKTLAVMLAKYCAQKNNDNRVYIYDHMTGKELAHFSEATGFHIE